MKLRFLGTSAATGFPNAHCRCQNCVAARKQGGKSIRRMSSVMIDDDLLIDLGPDVDSACRDFGLDLAELEWVLQTHPHADHLSPLHAVGRAASWGAQHARQLEWLGSQNTVDQIANMLGKSRPKVDLTINRPDSRSKLKLTSISPWQEFTRGPYRVQTMAANHDPAVEPMLFAIEKDGRRLFYGSDTTTLPDDTWPRMAELGWTLDVVVFDHNDGFTRDVSLTHMGSVGVLREYGLMKSLGIVTDSTRLFGTHISHHSNSTHDVEQAKAQQLGYDIAYDGLIVEI